jgi:hypothetical protein
LEILRFPHYAAAIEAPRNKLRRRKRNGLRFTPGHLSLSFGRDGLSAPQIEWPICQPSSDGIVRTQSQRRECRGSRLRAKQAEVVRCPLALSPAGMRAAIARIGVPTG